MSGVGGTDAASPVSEEARSTLSTDKYPSMRMTTAGQFGVVSIGGSSLATSDPGKPPSAGGGGGHKVHMRTKRGKSGKGAGGGGSGEGLGVPPSSPRKKAASMYSYRDLREDYVAGSGGGGGSQTRFDLADSLATSHSMATLGAGGTASSASNSLPGCAAPLSQQLSPPFQTFTSPLQKNGGDCARDGDAGEATKAGGGRGALAAKKARTKRLKKKKKLRRKSPVERTSKLHLYTTEDSPTGSSSVASKASLPKETSINSNEHETVDEEEEEEEDEEEEEEEEEEEGDCDNARAQASSSSHGHHATFQVGSPAVVGFVDCDASIRSIGAAEHPTTSIIATECAQRYEYQHYVPFRGWVATTPAARARAQKGCSQECSRRKKWLHRILGRGGCPEVEAVAEGGLEAVSADEDDDGESTDEMVDGDEAAEDGWAWCQPWAVSGDWEYSSFPFTSDDWAFSRMNTADRWYYTTRRRRQVRVRKRLEDTPSTTVVPDGAVKKNQTLLSRAVSTMQSDFYLKGEALNHGSRVEMGPYHDLWMALEETVSLQMKTSSGDSVSAFTGRDAVTFLLSARGYRLLPEHVRPHILNREGAVRFLDKELRRRGIVRPVYLPSSLHLYASSTVSFLRDTVDAAVDTAASILVPDGGDVDLTMSTGSAERRLPLSPTQAGDGATSSVSAARDSCVFFSATSTSSSGVAVSALLRDSDASVFCFRQADEDLEIQAEMYSSVINALGMDQAWLSDVTFDTSAGWFKSVSSKVASQNKLLDDVASEHRHRWKTATHKCFRCGDMLIEEAVVALLCGHTICTECCKVCILSHATNKNQKAMEQYLPSPPHTYLLVCKLCRRPCALRRVTLHNGLTRYETDPTLLYVWHIDKVYENQRKGLVFSKYHRRNLLLSDRYTYSDENGVKMQNPQHIGVPGPCWHYIEAWSPWVGEGTDSQGWMHAVNFRGFFGDSKWRSRPSRFRFVRRRCLQRLRIDAPGTKYLREELAKQIQRRFNPSTQVSAQNGSPLYPRVSLCSLSSVEADALAAATAAATTSSQPSAQYPLAT